MPLLFAAEAQEKNDEVSVVFAGTGVRWPAEFSKPTHPAHGLYNAVRPAIAGASCGCSAVFGATKEVEACGLPEIKDHRAGGYSRIREHPPLSGRRLADARILKNDPVSLRHYVSNPSLPPRIWPTDSCIPCSRLPWSRRSVIIMGGRIPPLTPHLNVMRSLPQRRHLSPSVTRFTWPPSRKMAGRICSIAAGQRAFCVSPGRMNWCSLTMAAIAR